MIQRKQTIFLLLAAIALGMATFMATGTIVMKIVLAVAALLSVMCIFLFKQRKLQAKVATLILVLPVAWYILLAVLFGWATLQWTDALPAISVILLFMAYKGIMHDEKLVRSLDRIR
ncbi:MAG: DUF4293 domain-containing protein [Prevotella sp.]|nr:DUF4293 domain-containing protein [Prevotella sp.]